MIEKIWTQFSRNGDTNSPQQRLGCRLGICNGGVVLMGGIRYCFVFKHSQKSQNDRIMKNKNKKNNKNNNGNAVTIITTMTTTTIIIIIKYQQ